MKSVKFVALLYHNFSKSAFKRNCLNINCSLKTTNYLPLYQLYNE